MTMCTVFKVSVSTAYTKKRCRCSRCMTWNRGRSQRWRDLEKVQRITERMTPLWQEFDMALRIDHVYVIEIARAASKAAERAPSHQDRVTS